MGHHGANFQSDLVLIPVEKTQGLEAFPFSQPPLQSRSVVLTSLELRLQFLIQVHGGARISQSFHEHQKKSKEHIQTHHPAHTNTSKYMDIPEMPGGGSGFWCLSSGNCVAGGISRSFPLVAATPHGSQTFPNNNSQWVHMNTHL